MTTANVTKPTLRPTGMRSVNKRQRGASLIEVMVGITVGLIILAGVVAMSAQTTRSGIENIRATRLSQQMRLAMDYLSSELQRAGYVELWSIATPPTGASDLNTDAMTLIGDVRLFKFPTRGNPASGAPTECTSNTDTDCDCVLFSYDYNQDGAQGIGSGTAGTDQNTANFELYGFRWNGDAIERRSAGNVHSCNSGTWQAITDGEIEITALQMQHILPTFVGEEPNNPIEIDGDDDGTCESAEICLERRSVQIDITGRLSSDNAVDLAISNEVKIKNDYYFTAP